jgi:hypothetical protein
MHEIGYRFNAVFFWKPFDLQRHLFSESAAYENRLAKFDILKIVTKPTSS